jgi:ankyrin repeat protein
VSYLLESGGGNPNTVIEWEDSAITYAIGTGAYDIVQTLIKHGADLTSKNNRHSALHEAAWYGHCNIVQLLLDTGMDQDLQAWDGNTPLSRAAQGNHTAVVNMLLPLGCNVNNTEGCHYETPLHSATFNGNLEMAVKLINAGANPDCRSRRNTSPLWMAVYSNSLDIVKYLLVKNVELEVVSCGFGLIEFSLYQEARSVLYVAADRCSMDLVMTLIQAGYNINQESWIMAHEFPKDNPDLQSQKQQMLLDFVSSPPTLQALCRNFCRRQFKRKVIDCVNSLEIPQNLKDHLLLKDFIAEKFFNM